MLTKPTIANIAVTNPAFSTLEAAAIQGGVAVVLSNKTQGMLQELYSICSY
jgi:hypothetical protein